MNKTTEALKLAETYIAGMKWSEEADEALSAIREALAEPEITTPDVCGEVCARAKLCYGCGKALDEANAEPMKQELNWGANKFMPHEQPVKQEPVAWVDAKEEGYEFYGISYLPVGKHHLYAAPVDAKAIRAEALEYAAYICDGIARDDSGFVAEECANAIRSLK